MKDFSIDLKNSEKGERKKAVKYLKKIKYRYWNARRWKDGIEYAYLNIDTGDNTFFYSEYDDPKTITLPKDWDKLIEYTQKETPKEETTFEGLWKEVEGLEEFKVGKWYKTTGLFVRYKGNNEGAGLFGDLWGEKRSMSYPKDWSEASPEEIKEHLIKEAKKRGFKEGVKVRWPKHSDQAPSLLETYNPKYDTWGRLFFDSNTVCIYDDGQWVEIIKEEPFKINGHEVKTWLHENGYDQVTVGCFSMSQHSVNQIIDDVQAWAKYEVSLSIKVKGEDVSYEDLLKLKQYLDSK